MSAKPADKQRSWWTERRFLASAAVIAVLVLGAGLVLVTGGGRRAGSRPAVSASSPALTATSAGRGLAGGAGCSLPAGSQSIPPVAPQTGWQLVGSMAAPSAPATIGPQRTVDGFRVCFAHSPLGALFAAVNFWAEGTAAPAGAVYEHLAADTSLRAQAISAARTDGAGRLDALTKVQVAGYALTAYDGATAVITLAFQLSDGAFVSVPTALRWEDSDWRYVVAAGGTVPGAAQISDLNGYVAFSGA